MHERIETTTYKGRNQIDTRNQTRDSLNIQLQQNQTKKTSRTVKKTKQKCMKRQNIRRKNV